MKKCKLIAFIFLVGTIGLNAQSNKFITKAFVGTQLSTENRTDVLGLELQPFSSIAIDFYGQYQSDISQPIDNLDKHYNSVFVGMGLKFFPFGSRQLFGKKSTLGYPLFNNGRGCGWNKKNDSPDRDLLSGFWLGPSIEWRNSNIVYKLDSSIPSPQQNYEYDVQSRIISLRVGYQIQVWHFTFGVGYAIGLSKTDWEGNGPNIFDEINLSETAFEKQESLQVQVGFAF